MERSAVKILVLDDEPFVLKLHAHMLAEMGFTSSTTIAAGRLALAHMDGDKNPPDLILLDLSMPGMDGIEFIRHLVERKFAGSLILVSGEDTRLLQTAVRLIQAHGIAVLGHLSKPVKPAELSSLVEAWEREPLITPRSPSKIYTAHDLTTAIRNREFLNHYQPKVSVRTGEFEGVEALARWQHPIDGLVSPARFIAAAEELGLIESLTRLILSQAMTDIRGLAENGLSLHVAVNVSAPLLASVELADFAAAEAARASVAPHKVTLEVTESRLMGDLRVPLDVLTRLRLMRFKLSIDDFGTGYSSLSQLRDIPFDELKIDQTFVHRASKEPIARAIFDASLGLARQLQMRSVAEGVEDRTDWDLVRETDCDAAQGYFIGRPMEAAALPAWALKWRERVANDFASS